MTPHIAVMNKGFLPLILNKILQALTFVCFREQQNPRLSKTSHNVQNNVLAEQTCSLNITKNSQLLFECEHNGCCKLYDKSACDCLRAYVCWLPYTHLCLKEGTAHNHITSVHWNIYAVCMQKAHFLFRVMGHYKVLIGASSMMCTT